MLLSWRERSEGTDDFHPSAFTALLDTLKPVSKGRHSKACRCVPLGLSSSSVKTLAFQVLNVLDLRWLQSLSGLSNINLPRNLRCDFAAL